MDKFLKWKVLAIILIVGFSVWKMYPPKESVHLGLDLQGGMQLLLEVQTDKLPEDAREDATDRVVEVIRNRIDEFGVQEPVISKQGSTQVVVQLPGVTDRDRAKEVVGKTAHLEFKLVSDDPDLLKKAQEGTSVADFELSQIQDQFGGHPILLSRDALLTGDHLTTASVGFDQYGQAIVQLQFDGEGAKTFDKVTFQNIGRQLAIVLDGKVHSAPVIRDRIPNGQAQISGNFTPEEASDLALVLRAGALPAPVEIVEERTVGPSLGQDSIQKGLRAGLIGAALVFVFMPLYYFLAGCIASIGLFLYAVIVMGLFAALNASLTLPGIAGFILSLGMAVDSNVLIFERMREEDETGKSPRASVAAGYHKAFAAILDSNVTTLLTSFILFTFGTGPVKGFAVTLSIGIIASMFSALVITRVIFDVLLKQKPNLHIKMLSLIKNTNIPFLKGRFWAYGFSVIALTVGILSFVGRGHENYGIEFTGGSLIHMKFEQPVDSSQLRSALNDAGLKKLIIQTFGAKEENQFVIKAAEKDTDRIEAAAEKLVGGKKFQVLRVDRVGPAVSQDLTQKALMAVFWASIGILIYLGFRFEWRFALASVVALVHDTIFTFGVYALSGREINIPTVAAVLTIMGYSVNDTIITFDRVRDNLKAMRRKPFDEIVNTSINQTLGRTIITTVTTLLAALALFIFGGSAVNDFAFILLVGFTVGTYSTIFVATSLVVDWKAKR
ncbi:MAG: protein translocase subunit SecD [Candidatus Omnitrophica bacterium]|nr:protein translocase subunit SecD [Candidatus Omnitrophota bacterium]